MPIAYLFGMIFEMELEGIGLTAPVATVGAGLVSFIYYRTGKLKTKKLVIGETIDYGDFDFM